MKDVSLLKFLASFDLEIYIKTLPYLRDVVLVNERSALYWLNTVLPRNVFGNFKNETLVETLGTNQVSVLNTLYHTILNLDSILHKIDDGDLKEWLIPLEKRKPELQDRQTLNLIAFNNMFCPSEEIDSSNIQKMSNMLPITKDKNVFVIARFLNLCPLETYYPEDLEPYPVQRALIHNAFFKMQIDLNKTTPLTTAIRKFVSNLNESIDVQALNMINSSLILEETENEGIIWLILTKAYHKLSKIVPSAYTRMMTTFENSIIPYISKKISDTDMEEKMYEQISCRPIPNCSNDITNNTIFEVLSRYEEFYTNKVTHIEHLKLCPIQVAYIIRNFPHYKNVLFTVKDKQIVICNEKFDETEDVHTFKKMKHLKSIKSTVCFDGKYEIFKTTISLFNWTHKDIRRYIAFLFYNPGFMCSTIAAEITKQQTKMQLDPLAMYNLISKLTPAQQQSLDKSSCHVQQHHKRSSLGLSLFTISKENKIYPHALDFTTLQVTLAKMENVDDFHDKLAIASTTNFNCIVLLKYIRSFPNKSDDVKYLMLFSSAPNSLKNLIYCSMVRYLPFRKTNVSLPHKTVVDIKLTREDILNDLSSNVPEYNCTALIDQLKSSHNPDLLKFLTSNP